MSIKETLSISGIIRLRLSQSIHYEMSDQWKDSILSIDSDLDLIVGYISHLTQEEKHLLLRGPRGKGLVKDVINGHSVLELHLAFNDITTEYQHNCQDPTSEKARNDYYLHLHHLFVQSSPIIQLICDIRDYLANNTSSQNIVTSHSRVVMDTCANVDECMKRLMSVLSWVTRHSRKMDGFDKNDHTNDVTSGEWI